MPILKDLGVYTLFWILITIPSNLLGTLYLEGPVYFFPFPFFVGDSIESLLGFFGSLMILFLTFMLYIYKLRQGKRSDLFRMLILIVGSHIIAYLLFAGVLRIIE